MAYELLKGDVHCRFVLNKAPLKFKEVRLYRSVSILKGLFVYHTG